MIRFCDILLSSLALVVLSPLLISVMIFLKFTGEHEIFYLQVRIGKNKRKFRVFKFATMRKDSEKSGTVTLQNDPRVLPTGEFLRKWKINELPQLINIFLGDMTIIGPRPLTPEDFERYDIDEQKVVSSVKPGLSGIASIMLRDEESLIGNSNESLEKYNSLIVPYKAKLESWFVRNNNLQNYIKIILLTIVVVLNKEYDVSKHFKDIPKFD